MGSEKSFFSMGSYGEVPGIKTFAIKCDINRFALTS